MKQSKKEKKAKRKMEIIPPEAKEEPEKLEHTKYEEPVVKEKSRYEDVDEETSENL